MSFLNIQGGYGLMGAAHSGLVGCNGYERWRMHWKHPQSVDYISARNAANTQSVASDITREDGNQTFLLRDFVTYGDVVRIKLPYKDTVTSSNQYIWLENHQVGNNNKLDFLQYSNTDSCRPHGAAGIYAYYQVGRDVLEGTDTQVWDTNDRDNLKIIPAEGYYDYELIAQTHSVNCINYDEHEYAVLRGIENPLCGSQDQEFPLFSEDTDNVLYISREYETWRKYIDTIIDDHLPQLGDNLDAFSTHTKINMGTNPSTNNAKTYHSNNNGGTLISAQNTAKNIQTTYLTGLSIEMIPLQGTGNFLVCVRWDDYDITNDTRWTGKIALKDTAILTTGNTITLAQNRTVAQPTRDPETGLFAGRTKWRCESGSYFRQDSASVLHLTENSSLVFEAGSHYELSKGATVRIGTGSTLRVNPGAKVQFKGFVEIDSGGVLYLYDTAKMGNLSRLIVRPGGTLIVDGGTLTSACSGEMWQGIEVVGDRTKQQLLRFQGYVDLRNGATIENAHCAIRTGLRGDTVFATTGGFILADSAFFINNRRAVEFLSYTNHNFGGGIADNVSSFYKCTFRVDDDNFFGQDNGEFIDHVTMWEVRGVKFRGCVFNNLTTGATGDRRHAIYTVDAGFHVDSQCGVNYLVNCECPEEYTTHCSFSGFTTAVEVVTSGVQHTVYIKRAQFSNNTTGVRIDGNNYATVIRNMFNLDGVPLSSNGIIGLYLNNCTGYKVEDNTFERTFYPSGNILIDNATGIRIENTGASSNSIYLNHFDKLTKGISVFGINGLPKWIGLQMTCNDFNDGKYDIRLNSGATASFVQGSTTKGADNVFSGLPINVSNFYNPNAIPTTYFYNNSGSNQIPVRYTNLNLSPINVENPCTSTLCNNGGGEYYLSGFQSEMSAYEAAVAGQSPSDGAGEGTMEEDSPSYWELAEKQRTLSEAYYTAVRAIMADSVMDLGALEQWHAAAQSISDPYSLTETRFMMGYSEPFGSDADDAELENYAEFHELKRALQDNDAFVETFQETSLQADGHINWYALTDTQIAQLMAIAERNTGRSSVMAKGVLCFFFGICYDDDLFVDDDQDNMDTRSAKASQQAGGADLNVYPNPTDDILYVEVSGTGIKSVGLHDLTGRTVASVADAGGRPLVEINAGGIPAGVYVLRVTDENGKEYHRKVVVK